MPTKKGGYSKVSSSKTAKKRSTQRTQVVTRKKPSKNEYLAYLQKNNKFIFERGWWYKEIGYESDYRSDVRARTEKGIKVLGEWYPKRFITYHDNCLYAPYWLVLDKEIQYNEKSIEELKDRNLQLKSEIANIDEVDEFTSLTAEELIIRNQEMIDSNIKYIKQYQESTNHKKYFKDLIDER